MSHVILRVTRGGFVFAIFFFLVPFVSAQSVQGPVVIQANSNRVAAGKLENGVLTLHLELRQGDWYPAADTGPSMKMEAFSEEGKPLQVPGPLIRVREGTEIRVTIRNLLPAEAIVHGLHRHPGDSKDVLHVPSGEVREATFAAGVPGTYEYWASAGGDMTYTAHGRPYQEDSQLAGAFIVDPVGGAPPDRVFVLGAWRSRTTELIAEQIAVINGKSWPYTERLSYTAGEPVRWRWVNASDAPHPIHLHGSYFRVDAVGDGENDHILPPELRETVVTHSVSWGETMTTSWNPPAGRWVVHCHLLLHIRPSSTVDHAMVAESVHEDAHGHNAAESDLEHMGGMVLGITVKGKFAAVAAHGRTRKVRLLVRERSAENGMPAGYSYQLEENHKETPVSLSAPGPPLVLERGQPVEITVENQLHETTTVHWHGMELESYYDGVAGWDGNGREITPVIEPSHSFVVRFTPPRAGTFMYHTHMNDEPQLSGGLYGPLIVLEPGMKFDPATDVILLVSRGGQDGLKAPLLLNGSAEPATLHWRKGQRYRVRLINITTSNGAGFSLLGPAGLRQWRAVAKDGADLPSSQAVVKEARQSTLPGETYDFEYQPEQVGVLQLEVASPRLHMKMVQTIEVE